MTSENKQAKRTISVALQSRLQCRKTDEHINFLIHKPIGLASKQAPYMNFCILNNVQEWQMKFEYANIIHHRCVRPFSC